MGESRRVSEAMGGGRCRGQQDAPGRLNDGMNLMAEDRSEEQMLPLTRKAVCYCRKQPRRMTSAETRAELRSTFKPPLPQSMQMEKAGGSLQSSLR
eukprot:765494-Hanusia_phi.AAC.10